MVNPDCWTWWTRTTEAQLPSIQEKSALSPHCRPNCTLWFGFPITLHPSSTSKCGNIELASPHGGWERLCITFKLYNSLYAHHFDSSSRKVLGSTPIISRGKSFRNYKVPKNQSPVLSDRKKNYSGQRNAGWVPAHLNPVQHSCRRAGYTHMLSDSCFLSLNRMPKFDTLVDNQHQKNQGPL